MVLRLSVMLAPLTVMAALLAGVKWVDAGAYRWVDAEGRVHYSDTIPAEHVRSGYRLYDEEGRQVNVVEPARTEQEIQSALEREAKAAEQARRDRILLATFTSEEDLKFVRDDRLAALNSTLLITREKLAELRLQHADLDAQAKSYTAKQQPVPADLASRLERLRTNISYLEDSLAARQREKRMLKKTFAADLGRYRELTRR
ncbi:MAG: DUF4124 domain-containing protein [Gammaproteobacteria bacterium]